MTMRSYRSHDGKDQGLREGRADACSLGYGVAASTTKIHGPVGTASLETYHSIWCEPGVENLGRSGLQHTEIPESNLSQNWLTQCEIWGSGRDIKTYFGFFFYILKKSPHFKRFGGGFSANRRAEKLVFLNQVNEICDFRYIHMTPRAGALRKKEKKRPKISPNIMRFAITNFLAGVGADHPWSLAFQQLTPAPAILQTRGAVQGLLLWKNCSQK